MKQALIFISICLLIGSLAGCGDKGETVVSPSADQRVSEGWEEYVAGNYEDAVAKFQEARGKDPDNAEAYNGIGWAQAKLGRIKDSIDSFEVAVAKNPSSADAHAGSAGAYLANGDYEKAIASAKLVLSLDPKYSSHHDDLKANDIRVLLAECYYNTGDYDAAKNQIDLLNYGKALDPNSPAYLSDLLYAIEELAGKIY